MAFAANSCRWLSNVIKANYIMPGLLVDLDEELEKPNENRKPAFLEFRPYKSILTEHNCKRTEYYAKAKHRIATEIKDLVEEYGLMTPQFQAVLDTDYDFFI